MVYAIKIRPETELVYFTIVFNTLNITWDGTEGEMAEPILQMVAPMVYATQGRPWTQKSGGDGRHAILVICSLGGSCPKSVTGMGGAGQNMDSPNTEGRGTIWKVPLTEKVGDTL